MYSSWQAEGPAKYWDADGAEWDISARPKRPLRLPLNGPGAVELGVHSKAQDKDDGEVERHGPHQVQRAAHDDTKIARTRSS